MLVETTPRSPSALLPFFGEGSPKIDSRKKSTLILTSLLEDLDSNPGPVLVEPSALSLRPTPGRASPARATVRGMGGLETSNASSGPVDGLSKPWSPRKVAIWCVVGLWEEEEEEEEEGGEEEEEEEEEEGDLGDVDV